MTITTPWRAAYADADKHTQNAVDDAYEALIDVLKKRGFALNGTDHAENLVGHIYEYLWQSNPDKRQRMPCPKNLMID